MSCIITLSRLVWDGVAFFIKDLGCKNGYGSNYQFLNSQFYNVSWACVAQIPLITSTSPSSFTPKPPINTLPSRIHRAESN